MPLRGWLRRQNTTSGQDISLKAFCVSIYKVSLDSWLSREQTKSGIDERELNLIYFPYKGIYIKQYV